MLYTNTDKTILATEKLLARIEKTSFKTIGKVAVFLLVILVFILVLTFGILTMMYSLLPTNGLKGIERDVDDLSTTINNYRKRDTSFKTPSVLRQVSV